MNLFFTPILGILTGSTLGYLYYRIVGCKSGTCMITGTATGSIIYGALLGYLIVGML